MVFTVPLVPTKVRLAVWLLVLVFAGCLGSAPSEPVFTKGDETTGSSNPAGPTRFPPAPEMNWTDVSLHGDVTPGEKNYTFSGYIQNDGNATKWYDGRCSPPSNWSDDLMGLNGYRFTNRRSECVAAGACVNGPCNWSHPFEPGQRFWFNSSVDGLRHGGPFFPVHVAASEYRWNVSAGPLSKAFSVRVDWTWDINQSLPEMPGVILHGQVLANGSYGYTMRVVARNEGNTTYLTEDPPCSYGLSDIVWAENRTTVVHGPDCPSQGPFVDFGPGEELVLDATWPFQHPTENRAWEARLWLYAKTTPYPESRGMSLFFGLR